MTATTSARGRAPMWDRKAVSVAAEDNTPDQADLMCLAMGIEERAWDELGPQAKRIILELIPEFVAGFVRANLHYGEANANVLGPAGQFADIWRKIGPLRRALWDGVELTRESPDEISKDLIGHLLLTIDMLRQGVDRRGTGGRS